MSITLDSSFTVNRSIYQEGDDPANEKEESVQPSTMTGRIVEWIRADRPLYQQVVIYTVVATAALVLILSFVGIPFIAEVAEEHRKQAEADQLKSLDQPIMDCLVDHKLKELDFSTRDATQCLPALGEMTHPIMKGTDRFHRPVLCFKIYDRTTRASFVEMIYRKYTLQAQNNRWVRNPSQHSIFGGLLRIEGKALDQLSSVINRNNSRFVLAE